jgi:hypothetical protein
MGGRIAGTPRKFTLEGIPYTVAADADFSENPSQFDNEMLASSGDGMLKKTKKIPSTESVTLLVTPQEKDQIVSLADSLSDNIKMSYVYANGDTNKAAGGIQVESYTTADKKMTLQLLPKNNWTLFLA